MFNQYLYNQTVYQGITNPRATQGLITAVARIERGLSFPKFVCGGKGGTGGATYSIFKKANTYTLNIWKSQRFLVNQPFNITKIELSFSISLNVNMEITPILDIDNGASVITGTTINNTNYNSGILGVTLRPANFNYNVHGTNNFCLQLNFTGTELIAVTLPINIEIETEEQG
jgi:hypothetical protein